MQPEYLEKHQVIEKSRNHPASASNGLTEERLTAEKQNEYLARPERFELPTLRFEA